MKVLFKVELVSEAVGMALNPNDIYIRKSRVAMGWVAS